MLLASIAQLAEHVLRKHKVTSSILVGGSPVVSDSGRWSRGMILPSGGRGRGFDSRTAPGDFYFFSPRTLKHKFFSKNTKTKICTSLLNFSDAPLRSSLWNVDPSKIQRPPPRVKKAIFMKQRRDEIKIIN